jgi:hypothetical protein
MYLQFKKVFEPLKQAHERVDTSKDIVPQVQAIVREQFLRKNYNYQKKGG